jgi:hypothetical protein
MESLRSTGRINLAALKERGREKSTRGVGTQGVARGLSLPWAIIFRPFGAGRFNQDEADGIDARREMRHGPIWTNVMEQEITIHRLVF